MNTAEKERLNFNVGRFDHYYDTINNKIAVYIAINTFLLGGVLGTYFTINSKIINHAAAFEFLIGLFTFMGLIAIAVLIYTSVPFLDYKSSSLYYFGTIAQNTLEKYKEKSKEQDEKGDLKDLREQVYFLSQGLNKKFAILKWTGYSMLVQVIVLVVIAIIIFNNTI